jgi:hypothetical protein
MAAPSVVPQVHDANRRPSLRPLVPHLGTAHRNRLLLALVDPAGNRAHNAPARVLQV